MLKPYLILTAIVLCFGHCLSQSLIKGVVIDDQNFTIYNAHLYFTGIPIGVISNENGHFELESDDSFKSFEVSFVGMKTAKIAIVPNQEFYKIILHEDIALKEVVVVSKLFHLKRILCPA